MLSAQYSMNLTTTPVPVLPANPNRETLLISNGLGANAIFSFIGQFVISTGIVVSLGMPNLLLKRSEIGDIITQPMLGRTISGTTGITIIEGYY